MVADHADAGGLHLAAEAQHSDVGGAAADVDDHPAIRHGDVDAGAESRGDRLINEVDLTRTGSHDGLHHGVALDAGDGGRHTDGHTGLDHVGAVDLIDEAADELPGHGMVADDAILQREDGGDVVGRTAHHCKGLVAGLKHAVLAGIHRHHAGLVEHDALPLLRDDDGRRTKIDTDVVLCHNRDISFLCCPFSISIAHLRARVIKTHYSIAYLRGKRNPLRGLPSPSLLRNATSPIGRGTGVPVRPTRDEQSLIFSETVVPCYRGQQLRDNIPCQAVVNLCSRALSLRHIELSAVSAELPGTPVAPLLGELARSLRRD